jgi:hypothetical protein
MDMSKQIPQDRFGNSSGFVLVAVSLLIALVTVLVTVICLLSQIERRAAANSVKTEQARENALFALNAALAQLQKEAGPDQRVTARAEILDGGTPSNVANPYWTGVWKTCNPAAGANEQLDSGTAPTLRKWSTDPNNTGSVDSKSPNMVWLVSNPAPGTPIDPKVSVSGSNVVLAKNLGTAAASVTVPMVPIKTASATGNISAGTITGQYAYWVSDEGVKARVNLMDPTYNVAPGSNFVQNQLHFLAPQAVTAQNGLLGSSNTTDIRNPTYASDLQKVSSLQSLGLVGGTAPPVTGVSGTGAAQFSPDATTYSYGVLADVRNGGLKTDLSQVFEDTNQYKSFLGVQQSSQPTEIAGDVKVWSIITPSFDSGNNMTPTEFGVRWQALYNYYSMFKSTIPANGQNTTVCPWNNLNFYSSGTPGTSSPQVDSRVFNYSSNPNGSGAATQEIGEYYMPQVLGFGIYFSLSSVQGASTGASSHNYSLIMYAEPRLVLYNPYNVTLNAAKAYTFGISTNVLSRTWSFNVGAQTVQTNQVIGWGGTSNGGGVLNFVTSQTANNTLKPGEIRVYGLTSLTQATPGNLTVFNGNLGNQVGQSQWQYVPPSTVTPPSTGTQWQASCNDSDHVVVSFTHQGFWSNDGYYNLSNIPANSLWPNASAGSKSLGRFFNGPPNENAYSADLGPVSAMASSGANASSAIQFGYFVLRTKGMNQSQTATSTLSPVPVFSSCDGAFNPLPLYFDDTMQDIDFALAAQNPTSATDIQVTISGATANTFWGPHDVAMNASDPSFLVLRDLPRQPMVSLGQFMHMPMRNSMSTNGGSIDTNNCLMGVGGSLADPFFALNLTNSNNNNKSVAYFDDNFLMNQGLFDSYYFSTVPPPAASMDAGYKAVMPTMTTGTTAFNDTNIKNETCVLPNSRMTFYWKNGVPPQTSNAGAQNYVPNYQGSAANLLQAGAFNVNSTSVPAWAALLGSLSGNPVNSLDPASGSFTTIPASTLQNPVFRFLSPVFNPNSTSSSPVNASGSPSLWGGINALTNAQVNDLAAKIVAQVKLRGPFLSMADFLNRRLDTVSGLGFKGALQAAIDNTTINAALQAFGMTTTTPIQGSRGTAPAAIASQLPPNTAVGVPGWLMQQDLVQCFSPAMTVRSDTFVVRCYGESDNVKTGATEGRAWGEAIVQRVPDYVDQTDPTLSGSNAYGSNLGDATPPWNRITNPAAPTAIVNTNNTNFGRRFKIVSFRWLNESDL